MAVPEPTIPHPTVSEPSSLQLTPQEFERRLAAHGHRSDEIRRLWHELAGAEPERAEPERALGLGSVIAVYLGLLLVVAASVSLLVLLWDELGAGGVCAVAVAYVAASLGASELARRRGLTEAAGVLAAVAVGWVGLATYAVQELTGVWPEGGDGGEIHGGITTIVVVGLAAAVLLLALRPDPLLLVPVAAATAVLAVDLAELAFGARIDDLGQRRAFAFALPVGVAWLVTGLWLDATRRRAFATWAHWCGLVITGVAVIAIVPKTVPGFAAVGILGAVALFFSAFVRHWSFTVVGALGVVVATTATIGELGSFAPVVIAVVGLALIVVGVRWSRWRESIRTATLARLPAGARRLVRRLAP